MLHIPHVARAEARCQTARPVVGLDDRVTDARREFESAYARWQESGCPNDRDAAVMLKDRFEQLCRERRALAGDASFAAYRAPAHLAHEATT